MLSDGLDLVLGGPALLALFLKLAFSKGKSADFVEGKFRIFLIKHFFLAYVEELYWDFSTYA